MEWVLGVNVPGHGASICLLHRGELVLYVKEERITRNKWDHVVPLQSLNLVPEYTKKLDFVSTPNCTGDQVDIISTQLYKLGIKVDNSNQSNKKYKDFNNHHHLAHAASGFYSSGFSEAICLVMDGWGHVGEFTEHLDNGDRFSELDSYYMPVNMYETSSIFFAQIPNKIELLEKDVNYDGYRFDDLEQYYTRVSQINDETIDTKYNLNSNIDIGVVYEIVTKFLGFNQDDCGKTMGMSAYGKEDEDVPPFFLDDSLIVNQNLFTSSMLINDINYPSLKNFDSFEKRCNLAYATQKALEKKVLSKVDKIVKNSDCKNVVLSGGIFHNVVLNSIIVEKYPDFNFFVDPLCDDSGHSAALSKLVYSTSNPKSNLNKSRLNSLYLGPEYSPSELKYRVYKQILKNIE